MAVDLTPSGTRGAHMPRWLSWTMNLLAVPIYKLFGTRFMNGLPLLLLTTVGARSGEERRTTLCVFPAGAQNQWLIVASTGGAAKHPAWYFNLARNPDKVWIEIGGHKQRVRAESLKGDERDEAWRRVVALAPGYGPYQVKTDRQIPIVRLSVAHEP